MCIFYFIFAQRSTGNLVEKVHSAKVPKENMSFHPRAQCVELVRHDALLTHFNRNLKSISERVMMGQSSVLLLLVLFASYVKCANQKYIESCLETSENSELPVVMEKSYPRVGFIQKLHRP